MTSDAFESLICDCFLKEQIFRAYVEPWYVDIMNFLVIREMPKGRNKDDRARFLSMVRFFMSDDPYLFKYC